MLSASKQISTITRIIMVSEVDFFIVLVLFYFRNNASVNKFSIGSILLDPSLL